MENILTYLVFIPFVTAFVILFVPADRERFIRYFTGLVVLVEFVIAVYVYANFKPGGGFQFLVEKPWIPSLGIKYIVGVDGISAVIVLLTTITFIASFLGSHSINWGVKGYFILFLILEGALLGTFCSLDLFLFFVFWEVSLFPMYFLIGMWGGEHREYAAIKFFLYTVAGSICLLISIFVIYFYMRPHTFDFRVLLSQRDIFPLVLQRWLWLGMYIAFAIKVPAFPFHTWLPDAHVEAPTPMSVILAGILLKMGGYGIIRFCFPLFPEATWIYSFPLAVIGLINIVYGGLVSMAQRDFKSLVAYSSISHMGYVLLGLATITVRGANGAVFQMFSHGLTTAMLFLSVGVVYDRIHVRDLRRLGGFAAIMPKFLGVSIIGFFAGLGLPGLATFISEFMVYLSTYDAFGKYVFIAALGTLISAGYMLWTVQRVFWGKPYDESYKKSPEIKTVEFASLAIPAVLLVFFGILPSFILDVLSPDIERTIQILSKYVKFVL
jgi:NADH-quinone oxidoreductase subunit M